MKKNVIKIAILLCFILLPFQVVNAKSSINATLNSSVSELKSGEEVIITLNLNEFTKIDKGINAYMATIQYDSHIFEELTEANFVSKNKWESLKFNAETNQFIAIKKAGSKTPEDVVTIKLKVKENVRAQNTKIVIQDFVTSEGKEDIFVQGIEKQIKIIEDNTLNPEIPNRPEINTKPIISQKPNNTNTPDQNNPSEEENNGELNEDEDNISDNITDKEDDNDISSGQTPEEDKDKEVEEILEKEKNTNHIWLLLSVLLLILLILIIKRNQDKLDEKTQEKAKKIKMISFLLIICILNLSSVVIIQAYIGKGEINGDSIIDYADVYLLENYLVDLQNIQEERLINADMNDDKRLTVTDLSLLIQRIERELNYHVDIQDIKLSNYYPNKGEEITFLIDADINYEAKIETITVNNQEYPVELQDETYVLKLKTSDSFGIQKFNFTRVKLDTGRVVKINRTEKIDVLKQIPSVQNFDIAEDIENKKVMVNLLFTDPDNSKLSGTFIVADQDGNTIKEQAIVSGNNTLTFDAEDNMTYKISYVVGYDLASNQLTEHLEDHSGTLTKDYEFTFKIDYQFTLQDLKTYDQSGVLSDTFANQDLIALRFKSSNKVGLDVSRIVINNTEYEVNKLADQEYEVRLLSEMGNNELLVEKVILSNGKEFSITEENKVTVRITKRMPSIQNVEVKDDNNLSIQLEVKDEDSAIENAKIVITDENGNVLLEKEIEGNKVEESIDLTALAKKYQVKVVASYNLLDNPQSEQVLYEKTFEASPKAIVKSATVLEKYVEKNASYKLVYEIESNQTTDVTAILVDNHKKPVKKIAENTYQVELTAPEHNGEYTVEMTRIFWDELECLVSEESKIEVLKDIPTLRDDYHINYDMDNEEVDIVFTIDDSEDAWISGQLQLIAPDDSIVLREIQVGRNEISLSVKENVEYTLRMNMTYGRDLEKREKVGEKQLLEEPIELIKEYNLTVSNLETSNKKGTKTSYFERGEEGTFTFTSENQTKFYPTHAVVNGVKYSLIKNGTQYTLPFTAKENSGLQELKIEMIVLNNGKEITLENTKTSIEILKEKPSVENFAYEETTNNGLKITFYFVDNEDANIDAKIVVTDNKGTVVKEQVVKKGLNQVDVSLTSSKIYVAKVIASYDLDTNAIDSNANQYLNQEIYKHDIEINTDAIELKDVIRTTLYRKPADSSASELAILDITSGIPTDVENYYAKIEMKNLPTYYANIKEFRKVGEDLFVVIDQTNFIQYHVTEEVTKSNDFSFEIAYTDESGMHPIIKTAEELFNQMASNLTGTFELTEDIDASKISNSNVAIPGTFKGTLNGNGHTIKNLPTALFNTLNQATVKNLVIENASVGAQKGILANTIENGTNITNVYIQNSIINNNLSQVGAFVGNITNSTIQNSAAININVTANNTVGGIAGQMSSNSAVINCYVTGNIRATQSGNNYGARAGGITGWDSGRLIDHCYTKVNIISPANKGNGGIIGGPSGANPSITNTLSASTGNTYRIAGFDTLANARNVYEYKNSNGTTNINDANRANVKEIEDLYQKDFYKETLGFDEEIWNLDLVEYGYLPNLKQDPTPNELADYEITENRNQIPNYQEVRKNRDYQKEKEILYYNLSKIMPFADTNTWVNQATTISNENKIAQKKIKFVLPLQENNRLVIGMQAKDVESIGKIKIIYEDDSTENYTLTYHKVLDNIVASYKIKELNNITYEYNRYLANIDENLLQEIITMANGFDYNNDIASLTSETESRLYVDYYNENVKSRIAEIILNYLMVQSDYPVYNQNPILQEKVREQILQQGTLTKLLYAYNYYDKWYNMDLDGIRMSDFLFFEGKNINSAMTTDFLINSVFSTGETRRLTANTVSFYENVFQPKTNKNLLNFLAYLMKILNGYDDPSDWMVDHFGGILYEQPAVGASDEIKYRIWDIFSRLGNKQKYILPILSAPQEDMYLISIPSQFIIGSMNRYSDYLNKDGQERTRMLNKIKAYANKIGLFYGTPAALMPNATTLLNNTISVQLDTRFNFPASSKADAGTQSAGTTKDPVMKWVYEAVGVWSAANGNGAYADGESVWWIVYTALDNFPSFSHETVHNQDGKFFYMGYGRRPYTGAEAHANGNIAQEFFNGSMLFNYTETRYITSGITNNLSYERINTPEKVKSYYQEMFETKYVLDYLIAQAFFELTPEEQAKVAVQASHAGSTAQSTTYKRLTAADFEAMNLQTMEDLWDNKIVIKSPETSPNCWSYDWAAYDRGNYYDVFWYQPHNDSGTSDIKSFKRLGLEMTGVGGYADGYVYFMSGRSANDLDALRKITKNDTITWKEYKLDRYKNVEANLKNISYFNIDDVINNFKLALKLDGNNNNLTNITNVQKVLYGVVKGTTNDFVTGGIYRYPDEVSVTSAKQLVELINQNPSSNYRLDADIDFSNILPVENSNYYISKQFLGILNGNGHKVTGLKYALFDNVAYAEVKNLVIESPTFTDSTQAVISNNTNTVIFDSINVKDANGLIPLVKTKVNLFSQYNCNEFTLRDNEISSVEDFLAIGNTDLNRNKRYKLTADLDFSGVTIPNAQIITGTFGGIINGQGHKITNISTVVFNKLSNATITNLTIDTATIGAQNAVLANTIENNTLVEKVYIKNVKINNGLGQVGTFTGNITASTIRESAAINVAIIASNTVGGIAGQTSSNSVVENCYVTGAIKGTANHSLGARVGGITGWASGKSITNCYTNVTIIAPNRTGNGGLIGGPSGANPSITNSISVGNGTAYRIAGFNALANARNVYEYALSNSTTNINDSNSANVKIATEENIKNKDFYINTLGWSEEIWDLSRIVLGEGPKLKGE